LSLEGRSLACSRGPHTLFRDFSFRVERGEWVAVRGPNGSGKTTLLRCVAGLTRLDAGEVRHDGHIAYAGHLAGIKDELSAEENLRGALALAGAPVGASQAHAALDEVGLLKRRFLPARRLSAGQRRRIGLARLMLDPAPIWILDEPLTALDDEGQALFARTLSRHVERGGLALVATHHDLAVPPARVLRLGEAGRA
jgi:heme exporter protein A